MRKHRVEAGPDTVHWGFFDAALKPLITIESRRRSDHVDRVGPA